MATATRDASALGGLELRRLEGDLRRAQDGLATSGSVSAELREVVLELSGDLERLTQDQRWTLDPYLLVAIQAGTIQALRALEEEDEVLQRRHLRIGLERIRHGLRDAAEEGHVAEARPGKELARWLVQTLDAPNPRVAALLGTSPRTLQRWISPGDPAQPRGDGAARVKLVARITQQLRHAITAEGVIRWFESPQAVLHGRAPMELLGTADAAGELIRLAAATRVSVAT